jgi:NAD(P)-dependent dehydrogenase (short-subunit alcohol dehydrogenase family)
MSEPIEATDLLRPGLLVGVSVVLAGTDGRGVAGEIGDALGGLGAEVHRCELVCSGEPEADDERVQEALSGALAAGVQALVLDASGLVAAEDGQDALIAGLEASWRLTRAVASGALIPAGAGGRIVYVAPSGAEAARAGLENLARTLSIEWARYGITPVSIALGARTPAPSLAAVVAYLLSPAGAYFSGTELDLRGPGATVER